jgi:hypothetical protein
MQLVKIPSLRTVAIGICVTVVCASAGCNSANRDRASGANAQAASATDAQRVQAIRDKYARAYPDSRVGVVSAALKGEPFVAVGELPGDLRENEAVTFIDTRGQILTTGTIVRVLPDTIHVRYAKPPRNGRAPRPGDVALLRIPQGAGPL